MNMRNKAIVKLAAAILMQAPVALHAETYQYLVTDLGTVAGPVSSAMGLNDSGSVAGLSTTPSANFHAVLWNGTPNDLGVVGMDTQSTAFAVNDAAQVVGLSYDYGDISPHAFLWAAGSLQPLGDFSPRDINQSGVVVGHQTSFTVNNLWVDRACRWTAGTLEDLGTLGGDNSFAFAINDAGWAAGQSFLPDNRTLRACLWTGGAVRDLGTIAGTTGARSSAADLNESRHIVGWSEIAGGAQHACMFQTDAGGIVTARVDLGVLGGDSSYAYGINDSDVVVGSSDSRGFIWQGGVMQDLNALIPSGSGWTITRGAAINESGVIVGDGVWQGFQRAVILTPVSCLKADMNDDGSVNGLDIQDFVDVMIASGTPNQICAGDVGQAADGEVTVADLADFVTCLLGGGCI